MKRLLITLLAICLKGCLVFGDLDEKPENQVAIAGSTFTLRCTTVSAAASRVIWWEYTLNQQGLALSDGRAIVSSHPNAPRYAIIGSDEEFHLQITDVRLADGGRYRCSDNNGVPPHHEGSAELIVLNSEPECEEWESASGAVVEGRYYSVWCGLSYQGQFPPVITWTGPGEYDVINVTTDTDVWSQALFTAHRSIQGGNFVSVTQFNATGPFPPNSATNNPDYTHTFRGQTIVVHWAPTPETINIIPIKDFYEVGDVITCIADSNPSPNYTWTNIRLGTSTPGQIFTVEEELLGTTQVLRCNVVVLIDRSEVSADNFVNVTVPALTTLPIPTTPPITTPPAADGPCRPLTGRWVSSIPSADLCIQMDVKGNLFVLVRNGTQLFLVPGRGKTVYGDYNHVGFTVIWPETSGSPGAAGFSGECHNCHGNEVLLLSGLTRNKARQPACGVGSQTELTLLYVMIRSTLACPFNTYKVYRPSQQYIEAFGIPPESIII